MLRRETPGVESPVHLARGGQRRRKDDGAGCLGSRGGSLARQAAGFGAGGQWQEHSSERNSTPSEGSRRSFAVLRVQTGFCRGGGRNRRLQRSLVSPNQAERDENHQCEAKDALDIIERHFSRIQAGETVPSPVIAYYGAGRAWLPSRHRSEQGGRKNGPARRWEAFYDCFNERIRLNDLHAWFQREAIAFAGRLGSWRPGYLAVKHAILRCVPDSDDLWYDADRGELVLSIGSEPRTFTNLSAGQRMMVALVTDIAIPSRAARTFPMTTFLARPAQHESGDRILLGRLCPRFQSTGRRVEPAGWRSHRSRRVGPARCEGVAIAHRPRPTLVAAGRGLGCSRKVPFRFRESRSVGRGDRART